MNNDPPQLPEQKPTPSVDDLIAQSTSQLYAFEHSKQKSSVKHRLVALSKTQKLVFGGAGLLLILVVMIGLSLGSGSKQTLSSSQGSTSGTTTTTTSTPATSDTNGDGVIDEYDTASTDETDTNETSWWQSSLTSIMTRAIPLLRAAMRPATPATARRPSTATPPQALPSLHRQKMPRQKT